MAEASGEEYPTLGIQYYGECWASKYTAEHIIMRAQVSTSCINTQYTQCMFQSDGNATLCSGVADSTALYTYSKFDLFFTIKISVSKENFCFS